MPEVSRTEIFEVPRQAFYNVVADYEAYPEFVEHMKSTKVLEVDGKRSRVAFTVHLVKEIPYVLDIYHEEPKRVWWELVQSSFFKVSNGSWELKYKSPKKTEVLYSVEVVPRILVPRSIMDMLTRQSLPSMMRAFAERALALHS
jgi:coenzyme Q-binding protein COQ10